jgi:hypothetical protein
MTTVLKDCQAIQLLGFPVCTNGMACQTAHKTPKITLAFRAPHRFCMGSMAYPDQPNSSPVPPTKNIRK